MLLQRQVMWWAHGVMLVPAAGDLQVRAGMAFIRLTGAKMVTIITTMAITIPIMLPVWALGSVFYLTVITRFTMTISRTFTAMGCSIAMITANTR